MISTHLTNACLFTGFAVSCSLLPVGISSLIAKEDAKYAQDFSLKDAKVSTLASRLFQNFFGKNSHHALSESQNSSRQAKTSNHKDSYTKNYFDRLALRVSTSIAVSSFTSLTFLTKTLSGSILQRLFHFGLGASIALPLVFLSAALYEVHALDSIFITNPARKTEELKCAITGFQMISTGVDHLRENFINGNLSKMRQELFHKPFRELWKELFSGLQEKVIKQTQKRVKYLEQNAPTTCAKTIFQQLIQEGTKLS